MTIRLLLAIFVITHLLAFYRLRRRPDVPFDVWAWYVLFSGLRAAVSLVPWMRTHRAIWADGFWRISENISVAWQFLVLLECLFYASRRMFDAEKFRLWGAAAGMCAVGLLLRVPAMMQPESRFDRTVSVQFALQCSLMLMAGTLAFHFWRKYQEGMSPIVIRQGLLLLAYFTITVAANFTRPWLDLRSTDAAYWWVNGAWLTAVIGMMAGWAWMPKTARGTS
jgi:hypothetical protein